MFFAYLVDFGTRNLKLESVSFVKTGVWTLYFLVDVNNITFNGVPITYGKERLDIFTAVLYATYHLLSCGITERETDGRHTALDVNTVPCAEEGNEMLAPVQQTGCKCKVCQSLTLHTNALYETWFKADRFLYQVLTERLGLVWFAEPSGLQQGNS